MMGLAHFGLACDGIAASRENRSPVAKIVVYRRIGSFLFAIQTDAALF